MIEPNEVALARSFLEQCRQRAMLAATAESCTGGLIAAALTSVAGSSDVFDRAFITYSNAAKHEMLGVPTELIERCGAVSEEVAKAMAEGCLQHSNAHIAISVTGIAGPGGGSEDKPVGLVHVAVAREGWETIDEVCRFGDAGRDVVRRLTVDAALRLALARLDT